MTLFIVLWTVARVENTKHRTKKLEERCGQRLMAWIAKESERETRLCCCSNPWRHLTLGHRSMGSVLLPLLCLVTLLSSPEMMTKRERFVKRTEANAHSTFCTPFPNVSVHVLKMIQLFGLLPQLRWDKNGRKTRKDPSKHWKLSQNLRKRITRKKGAVWSDVHGGKESFTQRNNSDCVA